MLNQGELVGAIHAKLATVKRFKDIIGEAPKQAVPQFKMSAPISTKIKEQESMLGKRGEPEKEVVAVVATPLKQDKPSKCIAVHAGLF